MTNKVHPGHDKGSENRKGTPDGDAPREMKHDVAQHSGTAEQAASDQKGEHPSAPAQNQTAPAQNRTNDHDDRESPRKGPQQQQSGEKQSQKLPGQESEGRAMSQNGARISDFEERPSR